MRLVIDKENLISLAQHHPQDELYNDVLRMLKRHFSIGCNFNKEELGKDENLYASFVAGQFQDNNDVQFYEPPVPPRPLKSNFHNDPTFKRSVFLLEDEKVPAIKKQGALLLGGVGEEVAILKLLFLENTEYRFERKFKIKDSDFNSWDKLTSFFQAQTDIILIDNFLFDDENLFDTNFFEIFRNIHFNKEVNTNIVVFSKKYIETGGNKIPIDFVKIRKDAMACIKKMTGTNPNFTFVTPAAKIKHDRNLFTNYIWLNSGDTFNYFNSAKKIISKGDSISFTSLAESESRGVIDNIITDLQIIIENNYGNIIGDKKSHFLKFKP
jgi:hypothetical protein